MNSDAPSQRARVLAALSAFAVFGAFWGVWSASIPQVRDQAGVSDDQLGLALLCIGAGALPAMLLTGRVLDRIGLRAAGVPILLMGCAGLATSVIATSFAGLVVGLLLVGVTSGAADVAMNSVVATVERQIARPIITRAHALLSGFVVAGSLGTAAATDVAALWVPFAVVAVLGAGAGGALMSWLPRSEPEADVDATAGSGLPTPTTAGFGAGVLALGVLGALAFASEGAHQNWSALFAHDELGATHATAALAPALFGAVVALTRLAIGALGADHARSVLLWGSGAATLGAVAIAEAHGPALFVIGLSLAAAGTSVLFPTIIGLASRSVEPARIGRVTSLVSTVSYVGFLLGPVYVGVIAEGSSLRTAMLAVAALTVLLGGAIVGRALGRTQAG